MNSDISNMAPDERDRFIVESYQQRNFARLIHLLKKTYEEWAVFKLEQAGYTDFKMAYMPFLVNINIKGTTGKEMAQITRVSKQAMSKTIKELESLGYLYTIPHETDKRSITIYLSDRGKELVIRAKIAVFDFMKEQAAAVGTERYTQAYETMIELLDFQTTYVNNLRKAEK